MYKEIISEPRLKVEKLQHIQYNLQRKCLMERISQGKALRLENVGGNERNDVMLRGKES